MLKDYVEPELIRLSGELLALGEMIEAAIVESVDALQRRVSSQAHPRPASADLLIALDHEVIKKRAMIEMNGLALIITHQLADADLRLVTSMLEIATELEHIGYYVSDIARVHIMLPKVEEPLANLLSDLLDMADTTEGMLRRALMAFERRDVGLAIDVHRDDDKVDEAYQEFFRVLFSYMRGRSRTTIKQARFLGQIARNLERAADRVTNICEWVLFAVTGKLNTMDVGMVDLLQEEMV